MLLDWTVPAADRPAYLADVFRGRFVGRPGRGPLPPGRAAALAALHGYDAADYGKTRNMLDAPVSRLSAYLRHGLLSPVEVRDHLRARYAGQPHLLEEFLRQLAWRDFFDKTLAQHGTALTLDDLEPRKHAVSRADFLPADVAAGRVGLPCVDGMLGELFDTGYLHNHERLWFAAYLCHFRGVWWPHGARLFMQYLLDGDVASNAASWQWVEGTFAGKPYFMNKENVAHFSGGRWCDTCTAKCPFDASYETLQHRLFAGNAPPLSPGRPEPPSAPAPPVPVDDSPLSPADAVVWVQDAAISPADVALTSHPTAAAVFVFDAAALAAEPWAFHRIAFVFDSVCELFAGLPHPQKQVRLGDPVAELTAACQSAGAAKVALTDSPDPAVRHVVDTLAKAFAVTTYPRPTLATYADEPVRFTRYWNKVSRQVLGYDAGKPKKPFHR